MSDEFRPYQKSTMVEEVKDDLAELKVTVHIGGSSHQFNKQRLLATSAYFASEANFKEAKKSHFKDVGSNDLADNEYRLSGDEVTEEAVKVIKCFLNLSEKEKVKNMWTQLPLGETNVYEVLHAAQFLQMDPLVRCCEEFVAMADMINLGNFVQQLVFADATGRTLILEHIRQVILGPFDHIRKTEFGQFDVELRLTPLLRVQCHKQVVAQKSSVLACDIRAAEKKNEEHTVVDLSCYMRRRDDANGVNIRKAQALFLLVEFMYFDSIAHVSSEHVPCLATLAKRFKVFGLLETLYETFCPEDAEEWADWYVTGRQLSMLGVAKVALRHLCRRFQDFSPAIAVLSFSDMALVMQSDYLDADEEILLKALLSWTNAQLKERHFRLPALLKFVRFKWVPRETLLELLSQAPFGEDLKRALEHCNLPTVPAAGRRYWPSRLVMVELLHPLVKVKSPPTLAVHSYDPKSNLWTRAICPRLKRRVVAAFDPRASVLHLVQPHRGVELARHSVLLHHERAFIESGPAEGCAEASLNMTGFYCNDNTKKPFVFTAMTPTTDSHVLVYRTDFKENYEQKKLPIMFPMKLKQGEPCIDHRRPTESLDRTCEVRTLFDGRHGRGYIIGAKYRVDPRQDTHVLSLDPDAAHTNPMAIHNSNKVPGAFEASFATFGESLIVRVGGWVRQLDKGAARRVSVARVDAFDADTFKHRKRLPDLVRRRNCCGVSDLCGDLYVVGGFRSWKRPVAQRNRKLQDCVRYKTDVECSMEVLRSGSTSWHIVKTNFPKLKSGYVELFPAKKGVNEVWL